MTATIPPLLLLLILTSCCHAQTKKLSQQQAIRSAEAFIVTNGYTDLPPTSDKSTLTYESLEFAPNLEMMLKGRRNSLERKAYGCVNNSKGKTGWTILFRYKNPGNRDVSRAITMNLDGTNKRVQHSDFRLSKCP